MLLDRAGGKSVGWNNHLENINGFKKIPYAHSCTHAQSKAKKETFRNISNKKYARSVFLKTLKKIRKI